MISNDFRDVVRINFEFPSPPSRNAFNAFRRVVILRSEQVPPSFAWMQVRTSTSSEFAPLSAAEQPSFATNRPIQYLNAWTKLSETSLAECRPVDLATRLTRL